MGRFFQSIRRWKRRKIVANAPLETINNRPSGMLAIYASAWFSLSLTLMRGLAIPLWCVTLGVPPAIMGVVLSARSFMPLFLSIHGGALIDRLGVRRSLIVLAALNVGLPWLYPLLPFIAALLVLELVSGLANSMAWMAAQTALARVAQGDSKSAGRFSFASNMGNVTGPLLVGLGWQWGGPMLGFAVISLWGFLLQVAVYFLPVGRRQKSRPSHWREFLPEWQSYADAFNMLKQPGIDLVVFTTFVRIATYSIQASFYVVALLYLGQNEADIGVLIAIAGLSSGFATLGGSFLARKAGSQTLVLVAGIGMAIVSITITPALGNHFMILLCAALLFGVGMGIALPLLLSVLSSAVSQAQQGVSIGLRTTANRVAGVIIPTGLGLLIDSVGIEYGFYIVGVFLLTFLLLGSWILLPRITTKASLRR